MGHGSSGPGRPPQLLQSWQARPAAHDWSPPEMAKDKEKQLPAGSRMILPASGYI